MAARAAPAPVAARAAAAVVVAVAAMAAAPAAASAAVAKALFDAAQTCDFGQLRCALDGGADPNAVLAVQNADGDDFTTTPLVQFAGCGHLKAAALLLDRGASTDKPTSTGCTPLMTAANKGQVAMMGLLAERGANLEAMEEEDWTAFHFACHFNQPGCVEALVRAGCKTAAKEENGLTGKDMAELQGHTAVLERLRNLVKERLRETVAVVVAAVSAAAENTAPLRALCKAARDGDLGELRRILEAGIDPNALVAVQNGDGVEYDTTALVSAAGFGHLKAAALLLDRGASLDKPTSTGRTPLMVAASNDRSAVVRLLLERDADKEATDQEDWTAFHFACHFNHPGCVEALVRAGCKTAAKDESGLTGKQLAEEEGNTAVLECLIRMADHASHMAVAYPVAHPIWDRNKNREEKDAALRQAFLDGNNQKVGELLCSGADPNIRWPAVHPKTGYESVFETTLLCEAIARNNNKKNKKNQKKKQKNKAKALERAREIAAAAHEELEPEPEPKPEQDDVAALLDQLGLSDHLPLCDENEMDMGEHPSLPQLCAVPAICSQ